MANDSKIPKGGFASSKQLETWLNTQPRRVCVVIAARTALRTIPMIAKMVDHERFPIRAKDIILPAFHRIAVARFVAMWPDRAAELRKIADARATSETVEIFDTGYIDANAVDIAVAAGAAYEAAVTSDSSKAAFAAANVTFVASVPSAFQVDAFQADAFQTAHSAELEDVTQDCQAIENGISFPELIRQKLWWGSDAEAVVDPLWARMKESLQRLDEDWEVWTEWYEAILNGRPQPNPELEFARITEITDAERKQGPKVVNAKIKEIIERFAGLPDPPEQDVGPHFSIVDGVLDFTPASDLDRSRSNIARQNVLLPQIREHAGKLVELLENSEVPRDQVLDAARGYNALVQKPLDDIQPGHLYGRGLILQAAINAANNPEPGANVHPLNLAQNEVAEVLTGLHGPFILASREGQELIADAERYALNKHELDNFRAAEAELAERLSNSKGVASEKAATFIRDVTQIDDGQFRPDRVAPYRKSAINNATLVLVGGAVVGGVTLGFWVAPYLAGTISAAAILYGKKSKIVQKGGQAIVHQMDEAAVKFVLDNEDLLRRVAGDRPHMKWVHQALNWCHANIMKTDPGNDADAKNK